MFAVFAGQLLHLLEVVRAAINGWEQPLPEPARWT
jgi:hypothetical protein